MLTTSGKALLLHIKVVPNSSRTHLAGSLGTDLKVKVTSPPEDGKANRAVLQLLAGILDLPLSQLSIVGAQTRPKKTIQILGLPLDIAQERLAAALPQKTPKP